MYVIIHHSVRSHLLLRVKLTNLETYHVFDQEAQASPRHLTLALQISLLLTDDNATQL